MKLARGCGYVGFAIFCDWPVAECNPPKELIQVRFDEPRVQRVAPETVHIFFQVLVKVLKNEVQLAVLVHHVVQLHDVVVREFFQEADFADSGGRHAFILCFKPYFLERDEVASGPILGFVDHTVRPFADFLHLLIALHAQQLLLGHRWYIVCIPC